MSIDGDGEIRVWDVATGVVAATISTRTGLLDHAAVSPDGELVVLGLDKVTQVWSVSERRMVAEHDHAQLPVDPVQFIDNERYIEAYSSKYSIVEIASGARTQHTFPTKHVYSIDLSPDRQKMVVGRTGGIDLIDLRDHSRSWAAPRAGADKAVGAVAFEGSGSKVVGISGDGWTVHRIDSGAVVAKGKQGVASPAHPELRWAADGKRFYVANRAVEVISIDVATGSQRRLIDGGTKALLLGANGWVVHGSAGTMHFVRDDVQPQRSQFGLPTRPTDGGVLSPDDRLLHVVSRGELQTWDLEAGAMSRSTQLPIGRTPIVLSDGRLLVSLRQFFRAGGLKMGMVIIDPDTHDIVDQVEIPGSGLISGFAVSESSNLAAFGTHMGEVHLIDLSQRKLRKTFVLQAPSGSVTPEIDDLVFSTEGDDLLVSQDNVVFELDLASQTVEHRYDNLGWFSQLGYASEDQLLLVGPNEHTLLERSTGAVLKKVPVAQDGIPSTLELWSGGYAVGTVDGVVTTFSGVGEAQTRFVDPSSSEIVGIAETKDGAHLIATSTQSARIWSQGSCESLSLVGGFGEWLAYTPDGLFDASEDGGRLIAAAQGLDVFRIEQFATRFNRPDLYLRRMNQGDEGLRAHLEQRHKRRLFKLGLSQADVDGSRLEAPRAEITSLSVDGFTATLNSLGEATTGRKLSRIDIRVNEVPIKGPAGAELRGPGGAGAALAKKAAFHNTIELTSGLNRIEFSVYDDAGFESTRVSREVVVGEKPVGDLYFIGFGVSRYENTDFNLQYAHKDALDLAHYFRQVSETGQYDQVHVRAYVDEQVGPDAFAEAGEVLEGAAVDDVVVVFVAGHGVHDDGAAAQYYYLTHGARLEDLAGTAAPFEELEQLVVNTKARRKLFLMDTCESGERWPEDAPVHRVETDTAHARTTRALVFTESKGGATRSRPYLFDRDRFIYNDITRRSGALVYSSSQGTEFSYESPLYENGAFTEEVISALTSGTADTNEDGQVTTDELRSYVGPAVAKRTAAQQHPTVDRDNATVVFSLPVLKGLEFPPVYEVEMAAYEEVEATREPGPTETPPGCSCFAGEDEPVPIWGTILLCGLAMCRRREGRHPRRPPR